MEIELLLKLGDLPTEEKLFGLDELHKTFNPEEDLFKDIITNIEHTSHSLFSELNDIQSKADEVENGELHYDIARDIRYCEGTAKLEGIKDSLTELESRVSNLHDWGLQWKELCLEIIKGNQDVTLDSLLSTEALRKLNLNDL